MKKWVEQKVRRYEHMRWAQEPNRRTLPFSWGLEHVGGHANEADPRGFLKHFAEETIAKSDKWYGVTPACDYALHENVLTFTSAISSPWAENNRVYGQFSPRREKAQRWWCWRSGTPGGKNSKPSVDGSTRRE